MRLTSCMFSSSRAKDVVARGIHREATLATSHVVSSLVPCKFEISSVGISTDKHAFAAKCSQLSTILN